VDITKGATKTRTNALKNRCDLSIRCFRPHTTNYTSLSSSFEKNGPTEMAYRWRVDKQYPYVCKEIMEKAYPVEVRNAIAPNSSHASIEKLLKNILGVTDRNARRMANFYLLLSEADPINQTNTFNPEKKISDNKPGLTRQINTGWDAKSRKVFIVHGHDEGTKEAVARFIQRLGLQPIILSEQPNAGKTIIEKFESSSEDIGYAVVLLTPDDMGYPKNKPEETRPRARQNVILELGYFVAKLGRSRICALYEGDVEIPSDYHGVIYLPLDSIWRILLAQEIKQVIKDIDLNKAFE
jgi:predicted nucleotide-binding protein